MSKVKKTAPWRTAVEGLPHARYLLSEAKPQDFNHIAFLSFEKPASHKRRALTNAWLDQVIPGLKESDRQELREAGNRLTTEWTSKELEREAFWNDVIRDETEQQAKKDRMEFLKAAGEQRLRSAERYLVAETRIDFELETEALEVRESTLKTPEETTLSSKASRSDPSDNATRDQVDEITKPADQVTPVQVDQYKNMYGLFGKSDMRIFKDRFHQMTPGKKWQLPSGACAEDHLYQEGLNQTYHHIVHSFIIDLESIEMRRKFGPDWKAVAARPRPPDLDEDLKDYLMTFDVATMADLQRELAKPYPHQEELDPRKHFDYKWIKDTVSLWSNMYTKSPSPFATKGLTELYWRIHVWSCIDTLFDSIDETMFLPGEGQALDSMARRNQDNKTGRKKPGYKTDGTLRTVQIPPADWLVVEGGKSLDIFGAKYLQESGWKVPREMHDILYGRMKDTTPKAARQIQIPGLVLSGPNILALVMDAPRGSCARIRSLKSLTLASDVAQFKDNIKILALLLKIKRLVFNSMELAKQRKSLLDDPLAVWDAESDQDDDVIWTLHPSPDAKGKKRLFEHPSSPSDSRKSRV
ncbi:hypothetical protein CPC16_004015 [Podila verticillata]|nr:hypothetical protein CPC16_004015 [Podila verticillata]